LHEALGPKSRRRVQICRERSECRSSLSNPSVLRSEFMLIERRDLLDPSSPAEIEVFQITPDETTNANLYPGTPVFLADRCSFVFRSGPELRICYPEDGFASKTIVPAGQGGGSGLMSGDGRYLYYGANRKTNPGDAFTLLRCDIESGKVDTILSLLTVPGTSLPGKQIRWDGACATISADDKRAATLVYLGDGIKPNSPFGILVIDLEKGEAAVVAEDPEFPSAHLQYCKAPEAGHDLMVQHAHGALHDETGKSIRNLGPPEFKGVDVHVIRDDGTGWRDMPWGRDGQESCIGHQFWRGSGTSAVSITLQNNDLSYGHAEGTRQEVVEGWPVAADRYGEHLGLLNPGARRNVLSRNFEQPRFCHLSMDAPGLKFAFDTFVYNDPHRSGQRIYSAWAPDAEAPLQFQYLLNAGGDFSKTHCHPILSPDGSRLYFQSNETGKNQVYMVQGAGLYGGN